MSEKYIPVRGDRSGPEEKRQPGHWLLAKLGKRVLRPGGLEMTRKILSVAKPSQKDRIVEFGPGVGKTAEMLLATHPVSYVGIDRNPDTDPILAKIMASYPQARNVVADAAHTGLEDGSVDLVVGEAMLTMQSAANKKAIMAEAARILAPGGRYAIHEIGLHPEDMSDEDIAKVQKGLSMAVKVGARPLTTGEWCALLEEAGLTVEFTWTNPMALLETRRLIADEGFFGYLTFMKNVALNKAARQRIARMRATFRSQQEHINAVGIVARKP